MDPKLMKLLGITLQSPIDDGTGEDLGGDGDGFGDGEEEEAEEDAEEEDPDDDPDEDGDEEDADEEGDEDGEADEEESEEEDTDFGQLSQRTQKRIKKLVAEKKDLQRRLEEAQKLGGEDGQAIMSAAARAGIMPRLMTKELAKGLEELNDKKNALAYFSGCLDSDEEEFELDGKTYSRKQLERREQALKDSIHDLEKRYGNGRDKAVSEAKELFELGLAAKKAGWKPGADGKGRKKTTKRDEPQNVTSRKHKTARRGQVSYEDVSSDDDLEAMIMAERRKKKGK